MAGLDIKEKLNPNNSMAITTFGQGRVGNKAFSDYVKSLYPIGTYYRVVHTNDEIPHFPQASYDYYHVG